MAQQTIVISDTFGEGFTKANENFTELYSGLGGLDTVANTRIPVKIAGTYIDSPLYWDQANEKLVSDIFLEIPAGTLGIGETTNLSACTGALIVQNEISGALCNIIGSNFDDTGADLPVYLNLGAEFVLNIQTTFTETITNNPLTYSITGTVVSPSTRQFNTLTFKTGSILTNVRGKFTDNVTGIVMRYIPSKAEYDAGTGITTVAGDNLINFSSTAADTAGVFNLGINPFLIENGQQVDVEIAGDSMDFLGNVSDIPYMVADVQDGPYVSLSDKEEADRHQTTGILEGGIISIATTTTVDWTAGRGIVSDYSDPENPVITDVSWGAISGLTPTSLATDGTTLFGYNSAGVLQEKLSTAVSILDAHNIIWFGSASHFSSVITSVITAPGNIGYDGIGSFSDFINLVIGPANIDGNVYGANGANLKIDVVGGNAYMLGSNFRTDPKISDIVTLGNSSAIDFTDVYRSAGAGLSVIYNGSTDLIDPDKYDDGSGTLATVTTGYWTIPRIFRSRTGSTFVAYGQQEFASKSLALEAKGDEPFTEKDPLPFMLYRCSLVVQEGSTDLSDTAQAEFFAESSFRVGGVQSSSSSIPGVTSPGGVDTSIQYNDSNTFGGDSNFTYDDSTRTVGLKSIVASTATFAFTNSSDVAKGSIQYDESTDAFKISPPATTGIVQIGDGVYIHEGAADGRIDIEAITTAGTAELTLSDAAGGTGLMITYDDATDSSAISGEEGTLTIETTTDNDIIFLLGGNTATMSISNTTAPDTVELLAFTIGGTNGGTANLHIGSRTPEGNVTANGGALYLRDDGTSSDLYIKRSDGGNTGWVDFIHSSSGVKGPASSTDDGLVIWDGTTGELLKSPALITINSNATATDIILKSPSVSGIPAYFLEDSSGLPKGVFEYLESSDITRLLVNSADFELDANQEIDIFTTSATGQINLAGTNLPDTLPLIQYLTGGTNGTSCDTFYGIRDPNSNVTGSPGDLYFRSDGISSTIYIHEGTGATNTDWISLISSSSGVTGPASNTANSIPVWNGTGGDTLEDQPDLRMEKSGAISKLIVEAPIATDTARFELMDSSSSSAAYFQYNNQTDLTLILAEMGDLEIGSNTDRTIVSVNSATDEILLTGYLTPDTQELLSLTTSGANGADVDVHVGTRNPNENVTALDGALYLRKNGIDSNIYLQNDSASSTSWSKIVLDSDTNAFGGFGHYQNLLKWSEDLTNAVWTQPGSRVTVTGNTTIAPNGETTADTLQWDLIGLGLRQSVTLVESSVYTVSFWAIHISGNDTLSFDLGDGGVSQATIESNTIRRYSVSLTAGANNWFDISSSGSAGTYVLWGFDLYLGTDVLPYAKTEAFALTTTDYGLSVAGNLRTDFAEIVSESAGALNTFRVKPGTFGSYVVLADGTDTDNITIECYEDGTGSNIALDAGTKSEIRSSSPVFEIKCNSNSIDLRTGSNDTIPPITIEAEGTNGAKIQLFSSTRTPIGNVTGEPGDIFLQKNGTSSIIFQHAGASANNTDWVSLLTPDANVISSDAATVNGSLAVWDGTSGDTIEGLDSFTTLQTPGTTVLAMKNGSVTGETLFFISKSTAATALQLTYNESTNISRLIAANSTLGIESDGPITINKSIQLTPETAPSHVTGQVYYDSTDDSLSYQTGSSGVTNNIGKEIFVPPKVKNDQGAAITNGQAVYMSGSDGTYPEVKLALADAESTSASIGLITETTIADGSTGYCTTYGLVRNFNTASWAAGDTLYLSPTVAGGLQNTKPIYPNYATRMGIVISSGASGTIFCTYPQSETVTGATPVIKSYSMSDPGSDNINYVSGFYEYSVTDTTLTIGGTTTQTFVDANRASGAHAFCVASGAGGTDLVLTVSGASITDAGVRTGSDSEVIVTDTDTATTGQYFETSKKWLGEITYTLTGAAGSFTFNYGIAKYEDFGNKDFTITDFEAVGKAAVNSANLNIRLRKHTPVGWTYSATAFVPDPTSLLAFGTAYSPDTALDADSYFAYKRSGTSIFIEGSGSEGIVIEISQNTNNFVNYANFHLGVLI